MARLFLLFTLVPVLELFLLVRLGGVIGALPTVGLVLVTGALGASLARQQGLRTLAAFNRAMERGQLPAREVLDGALIFVGGALLVTPGVLTDGVGLLLLVPRSRAVARGLLGRWVRRRVAEGSVQVRRWPPRGGAPGEPLDPDRVYDATLEEDRREEQGRAAGQQGRPPRRD